MPPLAATPASPANYGVRALPIPTNDLWIAALTVEHELSIYSRDARFQHLPQLNLV